MTAHFEPDEMADIQGRKRARLLLPLGAVLVAAGLAGGILATILKLAWLGLLGVPLGLLSWVVMLVGGGCVLVGWLSLASPSRMGRK